jgi:hypothetical protein
MQIRESEILAAADRFRDPRAWTKTPDGWQKADGPSRHPGGTDLPRTGECTFRSNTPEDLEGDPCDRQLLTKGYMRETV